MPITVVAAERTLVLLQLERKYFVASKVLKIALIEPGAAYAAELGQILGDALVDVSFEIVDRQADADLLLMNENAAPSTPLQRLTLSFRRTTGGIYTAQSLGGPVSTILQASLTFPLPLVKVLQELAVAVVAQHPQMEPPSERLTAWPGINSSPVDAAEKLHQRLLQAQKMEAVGELAGGIAHDFNNLLMVIRSYAEMLLDDPTLSAESNCNTQHILAASKKAVDLTRELLAFSRKQDSAPTPTDLNHLINNAVPMLSRMVGKAIAIRSHLSRELWPIRADVGQLEQVLLNLTANARDAMPHGGKLLVETANVMIETEQGAMRKGEYVMLAVSDTGQGIPQEALPRIFEPFFTTKERGKGTGLGLASVYGIVKHSGGYIWAYSETGYGTTFKIYLPRMVAVTVASEIAATLLPIALAAKAPR